MRIISDFRDYYDTAMGLGIDPALVYLRKTEVCEYEVRSNVGTHQLPRGLDNALHRPLALLRALPRSVQYWHRCKTHRFQVPLTTKIIGFCGFLHPAIEMDGMIFHDADQILPNVSDAFLQRCETSRASFERALTEKSRYRTWQWHATRWTSPLTLEYWNQAAASIAGKCFDDAFIAAAAPAFLLEYRTTNRHTDRDTIRCTLNPCLRDEGFQKIKPPAVAFQDLAMYMGNQLARQADPISAFPDELLRDEKGFDAWSFRRHPEEDKKYRKRASD